MASQLVGMEDADDHGPPEAGLDDNELADVEALDRVRMDHVLPPSRS
jgi:hypothetical protein